MQIFQTDQIVEGIERMINFSDEFIHLDEDVENYCIHGKTIIAYIDYIDQHVKRPMSAKFYFECLAQVFLHRGIDPQLVDRWLRNRFRLWYNCRYSKTY